MKNKIKPKKVRINTKNKIEGVDYNLPEQIKQIKAWAVVDNKNNIKQTNYFDECAMCGQVGNGYALYNTKDDADGHCFKSRDERIIRVLITPLSITSKAK